MKIKLNNGKRTAVLTMALSAMLASAWTATALIFPVQASTTNYDWQSLAGNVTMSVEGNDGFATMSGIASSTRGSSAALYASKVRLDGATVSMRDTGTLSNGDYMGFLLTNEKTGTFPTDYDTAGFVVNSQKGFNGGSSMESTQTRFSIGTGYKISNGTIAVYPTYDAMISGGTKTFGTAGSLVTNNKENWGVSLTFDYVEDATLKTGESGYWTIQITQLYSGLFWSSSYNTGFDGENTVTAYMWNSAIASKLDDGGNTYVVAFGTDYSVTTAVPTPQFSVDDSNETQYATNKTALIATAEKTVTAFEDVLVADMGYVDYLTATRLQEDAENAVALLRGADLATYQTRLQTAIDGFTAMDTPTMENKEWTAVGDTPLSATYDPETRYSSLGGLLAWGHRAYFISKVHLDGATIVMRDEGTTADGDYWGFVLSSDTNGYFEQTSSPIAAVLRKGMYGSGAQTRFHFGANHDFGKESYVWPTTDYTLGSYSKQFGVDNSLVINDQDNYGLSIRFDYVEDSANVEGGYWKLTVMSAFESANIWTGGNTANYNATDKSSTVYVRPSVMNRVLDSNGDVYVIACGGTKTGSQLQYKITDSNYETYATDTLAPILESVENYRLGAENATGDTFETLLQSRERLLADVSTLRGNDASLQTMYVLKYDGVLTGNENVQNYLMQTVSSAYADVAAITDTFANESNITENSLGSASSALALARTTYGEYAQMMSAEHKSQLTQTDSTLAYTIALAKAKLWLIGYETDIVALSHLQSQELVTAVQTLQVARADYESTEAYTIVTGTLQAMDKTTYEARLAVADAQFDSIYQTNNALVKDSYLSALEAALTENLAVKTNLDVAKEKYLALQKYVEIVETDGELYVRYTAAVVALQTASETYITTLVDYVNGLLTERMYTTVSAFAPVKEAYHTVDKSYLAYCGDEVNAKFAAMEESVVEHNLYYFTMTGVDGSRTYFENMDFGMYFEYTPVWGNRINYNKKLDLTKGVTVTLTFEEYETLHSSNSNNVFLNFLSSPDSYKGSSDGITLILWLSDSSDTSYVRVYNYTDSEIAYVAFRTPREGEKISVSLAYRMYKDYDGREYMAYVVDVNDGEAMLALTEEMLTANGHDVFTDVYFSLGGVSNQKSHVNGITVNSIAEGDSVKEFAIREIAPDEDPYVPDNGEGDDGDDDKKGCGSYVGTGFGVAMSAMTIAFVLKKKKEDKGGNE